MIGSQFSLVGEASRRRMDDLMDFDYPFWVFSSSHDTCNGQFSFLSSYEHTQKRHLRTSPTSYQQCRPHSGLYSTGTVHQDRLDPLKRFYFIITHALLFIHCAGTKAWISIMTIEGPSHRQPTAISSVFGAQLPRYHAQDGIDPVKALDSIIITLALLFIFLVVSKGWIPKTRLERPWALDAGRS